MCEWKVTIFAALLAANVAAHGSPTLSVQSPGPVSPQQAIEKLDALANDVFLRSGLPGMAVAVTQNGKTVFAKGYGVRRIGASQAIDPSTVFQLASLSKPVGATVVAAQVSKGTLAWDTRITDYLPWFSLSNVASTQALTIGDLYSHRSGLPDHAGDELEEIGYDRRQILERLRLLPVSPLRSVYHYTNFGLTAAAEAVAAAAGQDWETLSEELIYRPLAMSNTSSRYADFIAHGNRAHPHISVDGVYQPGPQRQPDPQSPAGGVSSNVLDMANWMAMVLAQGNFQGKQIVSPSALSPALSPQFLTSPGSDDRPEGHYGFGFNISIYPSGDHQLGHSGAFNLGAATAFSLLPSANTGIVVLTNAPPMGAAEAICMMYMDLIQFGRVTRDWMALYKEAMAELMAPEGSLAAAPPPAEPTPALEPAAYIGRYTSPYYGDATIEETSEGLHLIIGPAALSYRLQHWDGNTFVFEPGGEIATSGSRSELHFDMSPDGVSHSMTIEIFDKSGLGTFHRP